MAQLRDSTSVCDSTSMCESTSMCDSTSVCDSDYFLCDDIVRLLLEHGGIEIIPSLAVNKYFVQFSRLFLETYRTHKECTNAIGKISMSVQKWSGHYQANLSFANVSPHESQQSSKQINWRITTKNIGDKSPVRFDFCLESTPVYHYYGIVVPVNGFVNKCAIFCPKDDLWEYGYQLLCFSSVTKMNVCDFIMRLLHRFVTKKDPEISETSGDADHLHFDIENESSVKKYSFSLEILDNPILHQILYSSELRQ